VEKDRRKIWGVFEMNKITVVDLSWVMHRYRYAYEDLSCKISGKRIPTGHIYGTYVFVKN
jgi:hypothetical protein